MNDILKEITQIEQNIYSIVCDTPEGCDSIVWPLGYYYFFILMEIYYYSLFIKCL